MDQELELARQAAFRRAALEDGVIDALCGLCLLGWGLLMEAGQGALGGVLFATIYPTGMALRKRLIEPRIGHVHLPQSTVRSKRLLLIGLFTLTAVAGLVLFASMESEGSIREQLNELGILVLALPLVLIATVVGMIFGAARAHGYAIWIMLSFLAVHLLADPESNWAEPALPLALSSLAPLLIGVALFIGFRRRHPVVEPPAEFYDHPA